MRYSTEKKTEAIELAEGKRNHSVFFKAAMSRSSASAEDVAIILVGGSDHRSLALRRAQGALRFDRRPSLWSHAAIVHDLNAKRPGQSRGLEVSLEPAEPSLQCPERNGVTEFELERYFDVRKYPNVAFVCAHFGRTQQGDKARPGDARAQILGKLRVPSSEAERYPLWNVLGTWARYSYTPELVPNPLLENVIMPSAALCEYGFAGAGIDLTPGASANNCCPELLWSTFTHWRTSLETWVELEVFVAKGDPSAVSPEPLSLSIPLK